MSQNPILEQGYFLIEYASDHITNYNHIEYCIDENSLFEYIRNEFECSAADIVTTYSVSNLVAGKTYPIEHRMGTIISEGHIQLVHGNNLYILYRFLDYAKVTDRNGNAVRLSEVIQKANNPEKVSYIIEIFNDSQENYW